MRACTPLIGAGAAAAPMARDVVQFVEMRAHAGEPTALLAKARARTHVCAF